MKIIDLVFFFLDTLTSAKMKTACTIYEILILYTFSALYFVREFCGRILSYLSGPKTRIYMKCNGRTAIVTGGTCGIGFETSRKLLSFGMNVIIATGSNASPEKSRICVEKLRTEFPKCKVEVWYVDLSSMDSVKAFAEKFLGSGLPLHILINNAGIMFAPYTMTPDGFESHFAINYLSHCLLTKLLLPRLKQSGTTDCFSRIVYISSCLHYLAEPGFENINERESYCCHQGYYKSKLFQVMFTQALNRFLKAGNCPVVINSLHPGIIYTNLYQHVWWAFILGPIFFQKPQRGADISVYAALSVDLERVGGKYIEDFEFVKPSQVSQNVNMQAILFNKTWSLLRNWLDEPEDSEPELN